jgi:hypothetical protein
MRGRGESLLVFVLLLTALIRRTQSLLFSNKIESFLSPGILLSSADASGFSYY